MLSQRRRPTAARSASGARSTLDTTATKASYSVEFSQVARLQGLAFYRTAVDITNNTTTAASSPASSTPTPTPACANGFCRTPQFAIPLAGLDNFHSDDMVQYMDSQGLLVAGAVNSVRRDASDHLRQPAVDHRLGRHGHRPTLRAPERGGSVAGDDRLCVPGLALLRVGARDDGRRRSATRPIRGALRRPAGIAAHEHRRPQHRHQRLAPSNRSGRRDLLRRDAGKPDRAPAGRQSDPSHNLIPGQVVLLGNVFTSARSRSTSPRPSASWT